jgi:spore coat protein U-like protein
MRVTKMIITRIVLASMLLSASTMARAVLSCTASATSIAFGTWSPTPSTVTGTLTVSCQGASSSSYTISLSTGSGTYATRLMKTGAKSLGYNIYRTATLTSVWGNGTQGTGRVSGSMSIPNNQTVSRNHTMYGRMAVTPVPTPGAYSDTIIASVVY